MLKQVGYTLFTGGFIPAANSHPDLELDNFLGRFPPHQDLKAVGQSARYHFAAVNESIGGSRINQL
jgi:hypothetical protein